MIKFLLAFLLSVSAQAASLGGAIPSVTVSANGANTAQVSITPAMLTGTGTNGVFSLYPPESMVASDFYPLYKNGVAYQVGSSTKAYCFDITAGTGSPNAFFQFVSATAAITPGAGSITGPVYQSGIAGSYLFVIPTLAPTVMPGVYVFSSNTYAGVQVSGTFNYFIHMDCIEQ